MRTMQNGLQLFWWSYVLIYVVFCSFQITQIDIWWQLAEGLQMLRTGHLPLQPAAAFGFPARPYFDEYAGYEVVLALCYQTAGFVGLWLVFALAYLLIVFLPFARPGGRLAGRFNFLSTLGLLLAAALLRARLEQRPEMVGCLLLVLLFVLLRGAAPEKLSPRFFVLLFLIFFAWTNIHSNFVIGLGALFLWLGGETVAALRRGPIFWKESLAVAAVAVGATMLNPYGPQRLLFPFEQSSDPGSIALSLEMWPITKFDDPLGILIIAAGAVALLSVFLSRKIPPWLILFAGFSFYLGVEHRRFIDLAAISLLFLCAERDATDVEKPPRTSFARAFLPTLALAILCLTTLFLDAFNLLGTYGELAQARPFATYARRFAPELVREAALSPAQAVPVLCGHGEGAFLSFDQRRPLRPLLDSGMSHFSDESKRYFFFIWNEPEAFNLALDDLHVNTILIERDTLPWIAVLRRRADWRVVDYTEAGMLWRRGAATGQPLDPPSRDKIAGTVEALRRGGNMQAAFWYSTLLDDPVGSLAILAQDHGPEWRDSFFNFLTDWIDSIPASEIEKFLTPRPQPAPTLLNAMLISRLGEAHLAAFLAKVPPRAIDWQWKLAEVRAKMTAGDRAGARAILETVSPRPIASAAYYSKWAELERDGFPPTGQLDAYQRWQIWDGQGRQFIRAMSARLNDRIAYLGM